MGNNTKEIVKKYNIRLVKTLGQNFLTDSNVVKQIVDCGEITNTDIVLEVGPGVGSMTAELAARAGKVAAIEIDRHLIPALTENLKNHTNVEIINEDILKVQLNDIMLRMRINEKSILKVVANLPYYITTPIIMWFLEKNTGIDLMVFMVQKEVADRIVAKLGRKDYGALSVAVQYYAEAQKVFDVPPHCFIPQPEVDSTVIKLKVYKNPPVELINKDAFFKTVKAAFGQRRKTLINALYNSGIVCESKDKIKIILEEIGVKENQRGETLTINQFAQLANKLFENNIINLKKSNG